jgi:hypothetical protein
LTEEDGIRDWTLLAGFVLGEVPPGRPPRLGGPEPRLDPPDEAALAALGPRLAARLLGAVPPPTRPRTQTC